MHIYLRMICVSMNYIMTKAIEFTIFKKSHANSLTQITGVYNKVMLIYKTSTHFKIKNTLYRRPTDEIIMKRLAFIQLSETYSTEVPLRFPLSINS